MFKMKIQHDPHLSTPCNVITSPRRGDFSQCQLTWVRLPISDPPAIAASLTPFHSAVFRSRVSCWVLMLQMFPHEWRLTVNLAPRQQPPRLAMLTVLYQAHVALLHSLCSPLITVFLTVDRPLPAPGQKPDHHTQTTRTHRHTQKESLNPLQHPWEQVKSKTEDVNLHSYIVS